MPDGPASRTVLGSRGEVIAPAAAFLAHLQALNRSPETVRTCAISLKLWWGFLGGVGCGFDKAIVDHWHGSWRGCVGKPAIALSSVLRASQIRDRHRAAKHRSLLRRAGARRCRKVQATSATVKIR